MMTRLQFLRSLGALGLAAAAAPALVACAKDDDDDSTPDAGNNNNNNPDASNNPPVCSTVGSTIGTNHGHVLTLPPADVTAGVEKTYQIQGSSPHPHSLTVTAANFATLKQTGTLTLTSSNDANHTHSVTITCG